MLEACCLHVAARAKLSPVDLEPQLLPDDELLEFFRAVQTGFGRTVHDEDDEYPAHLITADRTFAVRDGDAIVSTASSYAFQVTVPGGVRLPMAAVSMVTVHPTHRRRGVLRRVMEAQLDDVVARGEPLAGLTASEASIYERFGYGTATFTTNWELESEHARLHHAHLPEGGRARLVDAEAAASAAHDVYSRIAPTRVGELTRPAEWWPALFAPKSRGPRFFTAVHDSPDGTPDAFARYRLEHRWPDGVAADVLHVLELQAVDAAAEAAMWNYLFGIDLVGTISAADRPVDDALRWRLPDPRQMRVRQLRDHLWLRVLDVAAAFEARTYSTDDALVLDLIDDFRPGNTGCWLVDGDPDGATCARTDRAADLVLSAADLGALYLGDVPASTLAAAGRVQELTTGAVARADRFLLTHPSPWCTTHF